MQVNEKLYRLDCVDKTIDMLYESKRALLSNLKAPDGYMVTFTHGNIVFFHLYETDIDVRFNVDSDDNVTIVSRSLIDDEIVDKCKSNLEAWLEEKD